MACKVKVLSKSINVVTGDTLTTVELRYWRAIHGELMTHRVFSRNAGSSRATPVKKMLDQVWNDPAGPIHWGVNKAGMQANAELRGWRLKLSQNLWRTSGKVACAFAWGLMKIGLHKQVANRILEPWQYINVIVSSTDWSNFYELRCHKDAQPEFQELAREIRYQITFTEPNKLVTGQWHLPYIDDTELNTLSLKEQLMVSTARNARVSIAPFDGNAKIAKEIERHDLLVGSTPKHMSPTEHVAMAMPTSENYGNFRGFKQYRQFIELGETP